jgi:hypothetical protein
VRDPDKQRIKLQRLEVNMMSSAAAEKGAPGMPNSKIDKNIKIVLKWIYKNN